jgi:hypothetical protein
VRVRRSLAALVVPLLLLTLSSCGDDDGRSAPSPVTLTPSPTATATQTAPPTRETPEQFIRRWVDLQREMQTSGETREFLAASDHCESCRALATTVHRIYTAGGSITTDGWIVRSVRKQAKLTYLVRISDTGTAWKPSRGAKMKRLAGGEVTSLFQLSRRDGSWKVAMLGDVAS